MTFEKIFWDTKAISINIENPFKLASGKLSPIYIDCRKLISYPQIMDLIAKEATPIIEKINPDVIAGGATAGIPFAAWISAKKGLPMIYVRKEPKGYGKNAQIEGVLKENQKVLLVEDLITDGKSKLNFINGIRNTGAIVENCLVVFDREQGGKETLEENLVKLHSLATLSKTLGYGLENALISKEEFEKVRECLKRESK